MALPSKLGNAKIIGPSGTQKKSKTGTLITLFRVKTAVKNETYPPPLPFPSVASWCSFLHMIEVIHYTL